MGATWKKPKRAEPPPEYYPRHWNLVHVCSLHRWSSSDSYQWGFDARINYTSDSESRLHPWTMGGRHLAATTVVMESAIELLDQRDLVNFDKFREHMKDKDLIIGEKYSSYTTSWYPVISPPNYSLHGLAHMGDIEPYFKKVNVIGLREDHIVVQLIRKSWRMEFLVIQKCHKIGFKVKSIYIIEGRYKPFLMEAYFSPDCSKVLLKPSLHYSLLVRRDPDSNVIRMLNVEEPQCSLMSTMFEGNAMGRVVAFDPRYHWRRLAVGTPTNLNNDRTSKSVLLHDLKDKTIICESKPSVHQMTQNLVFSPDGIYLGSLVVSPCAERGILVLESVLLYNSDTLAVLHRIRCPGHRVLTTLIPAGIFPLFSSTGQFVAAVMGRDDDDMGSIDVALYTVPTDTSLQNLCRLTVLKTVDRDSVEQLQLPPKLRDYLLFRPYVL